jgi:trimeric autotransporter adhesin
MRLFLIIVLLQVLTFDYFAQCWKDVFAGTQHSFGIQLDGTLWGWGDNISGQLGLNQQGHKIYPVQIGEETNWKKLSMGFSFTIALKNDGTLWSTGKGGYGESGTGQFFYSKSSFNQIGTDTNWVDVETGVSHVIALKSDGTIWTWGLNDDGQLGLGHYENVNIPTKVGSASNWTKIGGLANSCVALNSQKKIYTWGSIDNVQNVNTPTVLIGNYLYNNFYKGRFYLYPLLTNNSLYAWGRNYSYVLTLNIEPTPTSLYNPTPFPNNDNWKILNGGSCHVLGIKSDNTLWSWGCGSFGQLGNGQITTKNIIMQVGTDNNWSSVKAGSKYSFAIDDQHQLWAFGENTSGQLGDSTKIHKSTMVKIDCPQKKIDPIEPQTDFYPNPVQDIFYFQFEENSKVYHVEVFDLYSKLKLVDYYPTNSIDLSSLNPGVYVLQFNVDGFYYQHKVIKL